MINAKFEYLVGTKVDPYVTPFFSLAHVDNLHPIQNGTVDRAVAWNFLFCFRYLGTSGAVSI